MYAYVLLTLNERNEQELVGKLKEFPEVKEANVLFGEWDMIAKVEVEDGDSLGTFMMEKVRKLPGIKLSSTMIVAK